MQLNNERVIGFYGSPGRGNTNLYYVGENFDTHSMGKVKKTVAEDDAVLALKINAFLEPDESFEQVTEDKVKDFLKNGAPYHSDKRVFMFSNGSFIDIKHIFIERKEVDFFDEDQFEYIISCTDINNEVIQLFSVPAGEYNEISTLHYINFEVERLLQSEGITVIDEEDAVILFKLAVEYLDEIHNQVVEFEEEYDL